MRSGRLAGKKGTEKKRKKKKIAVTFYRLVRHLPSLQSDGPSWISLREESLCIALPLLGTPHPPLYPSSRFLGHPWPEILTTCCVSVSWLGRESGQSRGLRETNRK